MLVSLIYIRLSLGYDVVKLISANDVCPALGNTYAVAGLIVSISITQCLDISNMLFTNLSVLTVFDCRI